jgi:hypothetical protein
MRLMMANQAIKEKNLGRHPPVLRMVTKKGQEEAESMMKTETPNGTTINRIKVRHTIMCMSGKVERESIPEDHILLGHRSEK